MVLCVILMGSLVPSFAEFNYYFITNEVGFSQFTFSMFSVLASVTLLLGVILYRVLLYKTEVRTLITWSVIMGIFGGVTSLCFVLRLNVQWGINDLLFVIITDSITGVAYMCFSHLP